MGAGGVVQQHAKVLLVAVTDPSFYDSLTPSTKTKVDAIEAKGPLICTKADVITLAHALLEVSKT